MLWRRDIVVPAPPAMFLLTVRLMEGDLVVLALVMAFKPVVEE